MKPSSFINKTLPPSAKEADSALHENDAFFPLVQKFKIISPHAAESDIRRVIARILSELNACPEFEDFLPLPPLWKQEPLAQDFNPNHYGEGSGHGGQFAPKEEAEYARPSEIQILSTQQSSAPPSKAEESSPAKEETYHSSIYPIPRGADLHRLFDVGDNYEPSGSVAWLEAHEGINNSHTIERHVAKSIGYLKSRLKFDPKLDFVSTFPDKETAAKTIWEAIQANENKIMKGVAKGRKKIEFEFKSDKIIGSVLKEGDKKPVETRRIQVVLKPNKTTNGYLIYTAYPIL